MPGPFPKERHGQFSQGPEKGSLLGYRCLLYVFSECLRRGFQCEASELIAGSSPGLKEKKC